MVRKGTPIETYILEGKEILVKREDLAAFPPLPPFSKVRGLFKVLKRLRGVPAIGYTETSISMAGVGVAEGCKEFGIPCVIYNPVYMNPNKTLILHRKRWKEAGAKIVDIKAGRAKVNFYLSRRMLREEFGKKAVMLPLGLPFEDTIKETSWEVKRLPINYRSVVVNVGSGTICAGLLRGFRKTDIPIYGIMGRTGSIKRKRDEILRRSQVIKTGLLKEGGSFSLIDPGYEYTEKVSFPCPFPSSPEYDMKALRWLLDNYDSLEKPVLFWNIGGSI